MKNHSLISSLYAALVLSACFIQGYSLPSKSLQRWGHSLSEAGHQKYKAHNSGSHRRNSPGSSVRPPRTSAMPLMMPPSNPQPRRSPVCWPQRWSSPPRSSLSSLASSPGRPGPARLTGWTGLIWMARILSPGGTSSTSDWRFSWPSCPHSRPLRSLTETGFRWENFVIKLISNHNLCLPPACHGSRHRGTDRQQRPSWGQRDGQAGRRGVRPGGVSGPGSRHLHEPEKLVLRAPQSLSCDKQKFFQYCSFWVIKQGPPPSLHHVTPIRVSSNMSQLIEA